MTTPYPFSWLSTKQVCQRWSAHFAAYPEGHMKPYRARETES